MIGDLAAAAVAVVVVALEICSWASFVCSVSIVCTFFWVNAAASRARPLLSFFLSLSHYFLSFFKIVGQSVYVFEYEFRITLFPLPQITSSRLVVEYS
mgnify:CR=1 FL=1